MPKDEGFFRLARGFDAGILTDFKNGKNEKKD